MTASEQAGAEGVLKAVAAPSRVWIPLSATADLAAAALPPGTRVAGGETVAQRVREISHAPLAPLAGTLGNVSPRQLLGGEMVAAVELNVESAQPAVAMVERPAVTDLVGLIERLREMGVWAARYATPNLIAQLHHAVTRSVDTIICTVLDCDAALRLNGLLANEQPQRLATTVAALRRLTNARRALIAVEGYSAEGGSGAVRRAAGAAKVQVLELSNNYPQPNPTLMLYSLTRRRLRPGQLPTSQGVLVIDAAAALDIGAAMEGTAHLTTPVAIHDHVGRRQHWLSAPVGTPVSWLLGQVSIAEGSIARGGDLLRDLRIGEDAIVGGAELTIHVTAPELPTNPEPCIRCGWCLTACPTLVQPAVVLEAAQRQDAAMADRAGVHACIDCGLCSHVCPSWLPVLQGVREMRLPVGAGTGRP